MERKRRSPVFPVYLLMMAALVSMAFALHSAVDADAVPQRKHHGADTETYDDGNDDRHRPKWSYFAQERVFPDDWPENLVELYDKNPEAWEFILNYFDDRDTDFDIDLTELEDCDEPPLLMQWDRRWGYRSYAGNMMGLSGCGPTVLSMAAIYLTGDASWDPLTVANYSERNGHAVSGNGTAWTLFSEGAEGIGLKSRELPLNKGDVDAALGRGRLVACILGPGDFTDTGHYILITGVADNGEYKVNDPNSAERSSETWSYDKLSPQIRNLWSLSAK